MLRDYLTAHGHEELKFYCDDVFDFQWNSISESVDLICSLGFLEHLRNPNGILRLASTALKPGGIVLSQIPNLFSVNAKLMRKYDPDSWSQHVPYDTDEFDALHIDAGFNVVVPAEYCGGYKEHMLIPWGKIKSRMNILAYKLLRYAMSFVVQPLANALPSKGQKSYCASIVGVYQKPPA